jgi:hypothetical protein
MSTLEEAKRRVADNIGSLEHLCKEAICLADYNLMVAMGFPEVASKRLCAIIISKAKDLRIKDLKAHFKRHLEENKSNIINVIIREKHKVYFATRSNLHPIILLEHLEAGYGEDLCSLMFKSSMVHSSKCLDNRRKKIVGKGLVKTGVKFTKVSNTIIERYNTLITEDLV